MIICGMQLLCVGAMLPNECCAQVCLTSDQLKSDIPSLAKVNFRIFSNKKHLYLKETLSGTGIASAQGFPVPRIIMNGSILVHVIYTQFSLAAALRSDNANEGFRMPLPLRFEATTNEHEHAGDHAQSSGFGVRTEIIVQQQHRRSADGERAHPRGRIGPRSAATGSATNVEIGSRAASSSQSAQLVAAQTTGMTPEKKKHVYQSLTMLPS